MGHQATKDYTSVHHLRLAPVRAPLHYYVTDAFGPLIQGIESEIDSTDALALIYKDSGRTEI